MAAASRQEPPPAPLLSVVSTARPSVPLHSGEVSAALTSQRSRPERKNLSTYLLRSGASTTGWTDTQSPPQPRRRSTDLRQRVETALQEPFEDNASLALQPEGIRLMEVRRQSKRAGRP